MRFLGLISYPDPSLILSLVEVQSLIQSDSPLVAILKFAVSSWCEAWDRGIFGAARISSSFNSANDNIFREFTDCPRPPNISGLKGPVSRKSGNFWGAERCFVFSAFTFKIRVSSIILKIIKWNYQLTKQNWLVYKLGTVLLFLLFLTFCRKLMKRKPPVLIWFRVNCWKWLLISSHPLLPQYSQSLFSLGYIQTIGKQPKWLHFLKRALNRTLTTTGRYL